MMRALFAGEEVSHDGHVVVDRARLWTLPDDAAAAAVRGGERGDRALGRRVGRRAGDGQRAGRDAAAAAATRSGATAGAVLQVHVSLGADRRRRRSGSRYDQWRTNVFDPPVCWDLDTPEAFDAAAAVVRPEDVAARCWSPPIWQQHVAWLQEFAALGFDDIALHHVGQDLDAVHRRVRRARAPGAAMSIKATSDLWWKNAIFYCLDVETFYDFDGDGCGDLPGLTERDRLPRRARHQLPVADAVLPVAQPRRRLRHRRLLRASTRPRHARRLHRADPHVPRPRHPRDRRLRHEPHVRPAPVVPGRALEPRLAVPRLLRLARREARRRSRATSSSRTRRARTGPTTARPSSTTCTSSTRTSRT